LKAFSLLNINCWDDFKVYAESMPNTKSMGDAFEQLTKLYFQINPLYRSKYEQVWLLDEVPSKDLEYLDLPRQDLGVDLIAKSGDEYHAIQCKYHSDKTNTVKNSEISTFTSILANKKNLSHIKSSYEWMKLIDQIREDYPKMPKNPINAYKGKGFKDWIDFIGKED
jgi:predicted helicase